LIRSLVRKNLGEVSVFRKVRSELLRPILGLLDPVKHRVIEVCTQHAMDECLKIAPVCPLLTSWIWRE